MNRFWITYVGPFCQSFRVLVPRYLDADRVAQHLIEIGILGGGTVEELPPQQLAVQRQRRERFLNFLIEISQLVVKQSCGKATKS